jgi:hypothetical protein
MHWEIFGYIAVPTIMVLGALFKQHADFSELKSEVRGIAKEFKPNGGSSLKDDVTVLKTKFDDHLKQHAGQWR